LSAPKRLGAPRHFYLLWDEDLDELQPLLSVIVAERASIVTHWYKLYELHFGGNASLSETEFRRIFESALLLGDGALLDKNIDLFAENITKLGEELAARRVPLREVIVSLHLFEESVLRVCTPDKAVSLQTYVIFDKLSHLRTLLMTDAYMRIQAAETSARIIELEQEAAQLPHDARKNFHGLVGSSPQMRMLYERVEAAARTVGTVLIVGESGTGKELIARAIHECSKAASAPFIALNCAALPKDLIESELFGYKRGAFSGAVADYPALFRAAEGGSLFLDEVTEMSADTQSKLLRAIQERSVRPVGALREIPFNVRLIASTNRDPEQAVHAGQLRQDLYYRLQASVLRVPPLRERASDIPLLVEHFIALFNQRMVRAEPFTGIAPIALNAMINYQWPGNVRELSNAIEGAFTFGQGPLIQLQDLPAGVSHLTPSGQTTQGPAPGRPTTFAEVERDLISRALESTDHNKSAAAKLLGISRKKLYAKISKYALE
jgi:two-component system response regulator HydG